MQARGDNCPLILGGIENGGISLVLTSRRDFDIISGMFRTVYVVVALVALASGGCVGDTSIIIEGEAWTEGSLEDVRYSPELGGLILAGPVWSPIWEVELPGVIGAEIVTAGNAIYLVGSYEAEKGRQAWLAAFSHRGRMLWEARVQGFWRADSHLTAVSIGPEGDLFVTGWYGSAFALAAFTEDGRELWALSNADGESILGTDVSAFGGLVLASAIRWRDGQAQGILFCYGIDGSLWWELSLPDAEEVTALITEEGGSWVLWGGKAGWAVSRVDWRGRLERSYPCPEDVEPLDLVLWEGQPVVVGVRGERLLLLSLDGEVRLSLPHQASGASVRRVIPGLEGEVAAVGWRGDQGWLALWRSGCGMAWEATITGRAIRPLATVPTGEGNWLVLSTDRADAEVVSRLSLWAPPPERRGEYASPIFTCGSSDRPVSLQVDAAGLSGGAVRVILEAYVDGNVTPTIHRYDVEAEHFRVPLDLGDCVRFRLVLQLTGMCPGSPLVRRLEVVIGTAVSEQPAAETVLTAEGAGGTPPETGSVPLGEEGGSRAPEEESRHQPPLASPGADLTIVASTEVGLVGETEFAFEVENGEGGPWTWDLGDGTGALGQSVRHVYDEPGIYTVSVRDPEGRVSQARMAVLQAHYVRSTLLMYLPGSQLVCGDFDGDGCGDLIVWSDKAQSLFLFRGKGDGTVEFLANRPLLVDVAWITATDMDGDGRDDLLAGSTEDAILVLLRGSPHGLLGLEEFSSLTVMEAVPVRVYPASEQGLTLLGHDREGRLALAKISVDGGHPRSSPAVALPDSHGVLVTLGDTRGRLVEGCEGFWMDLTGSEAMARLPGRSVLALGDLNGDGGADAIARVGDEVEAFLSGGEAALLGMSSPADLWLLGDLAGFGVDQVVRISRGGTATLTVFAPFRGTFSLDLSLVPDRAIIMGPDANGPARLVIVSGRGEVLLVSLANH